MLSVSQHLKFMEVLLSTVESLKMEFRPFTLLNWSWPWKVTYTASKVCSAAFDALLHCQG